MLPFSNNVMRVSGFLRLLSLEALQNGLRKRKLDLIFHPQRCSMTRSNIYDGAFAKIVNG